MGDFEPMKVCPTCGMNVENGTAIGILIHTLAHTNDLLSEVEAMTVPPKSTTECEACQNWANRHNRFPHANELMTDHHALLLTVERQRDELRDVDRWASAFHEAWMRWAQTLMLNEPLSAQRVARWKTLMVPYDQLPENMKERDREQARRALTSSPISQSKPCGPSSRNSSPRKSSVSPSEDSLSSTTGKAPTTSESESSSPSSTASPSSTPSSGSNEPIKQAETTGECEFAYGEAHRTQALNACFHDRELHALLAERTAELERVREDTRLLDEFPIGVYEDRSDYHIIQWVRRWKARQKDRRALERSGP